MLFLLGLFTVQNHDSISYPFIYLKTEKVPLSGRSLPVYAIVGRIPREPFSSLDPVVSLEQNQPSGPGDQNDLHYRIREMSGASSIWLGDSDTERCIDNQSSILYYSICCTSHPGAINVMLINFRVFFENSQLIGLVLTLTNDQGFF